MRWLAAVKKANLAHLPVVAGMEPSHHLFHPTPHGGIYGTKGTTRPSSPPPPSSVLPATTTLPFLCLLRLRLRLCASACTCVSDCLVHRHHRLHCVASLRRVHGDQVRRLVPAHDAQPRRRGGRERRRQGLRRHANMHRLQNIPGAPVWPLVEPLSSRMCGGPSPSRLSLMTFSPPASPSLVGRGAGRAVLDVRAVPHLLPPGASQPRTHGRLHLPGAPSLQRLSLSLSFSLSLQRSLSHTGASIFQVSPL